jgi:predicted GNAT superfamily acetyltransferase
MERDEAVSWGRTRQRHTIRKNAGDTVRGCSGTSGEIEVRRARSLDEMIEVTLLQRKVWGPSWRETISPEFLRVHAEMGALVLCAFDRGQLVGFVYSFPGERNGEWIHWSHMLAVSREYRGCGIGKILKLAQREEVLKEGYGKCCWTFDPLQPVNARLNIVALGGRADEYVIDAYGQRDNNLDGGLPTDRLIVKWHLMDAEVVARASGRYQRSATKIGEIASAMSPYRSADLTLPRKADLELTEPLIGVPVPASIRGMIDEDLEAGMDWRLATREVFRNYIRRGYSVVDVLNAAESGGDEYVYILQAPGAAKALRADCGGRSRGMGE